MRALLHAIVGATIVLVSVRALAEPAPAPEGEPAPPPDAGVEPVVDAASPTSPASADDAKPAVAPAPVEEAAPDVEFPEAGDGDLDQAPAKLQIYGFADMTARRVWLGGDDSLYRLYTTPEAGFAMGRINLYFRAEPSPRISSLLEVRLLYLPNGATSVTPTGVLDVANTTVPDDVELGGTLAWGGISIQRAQLDYQLTDHLTIRVGHWLTPYGIWNVDHGSPTVIGVRRPYIINQNLFPESQIGVQLLGRRAIGKSELTWAATLSNGTAGLTSRLDHDLDKAIGGRAELTIPALDELRIGVSAYVGLAHASEFHAIASDPADPSTIKLERVDLSASTQLAFGADFRLRAGRLRLMGEALMARERFGSVRPMAVAPRTTGFEPDLVNLGYYLVGGIQTAWHGAMPYVQVEESLANNLDSHLRIAVLGLNVRPVPTVTLKADISAGRLSSWGAPLLPTTNLLSVGAQIAWVFR